MFTAVLLILFHGMSAPAVYQQPGHEKPFVSHGACDEWARQEARRIERAIGVMERDKRPEQWEIRCVPIGPLREASK